MARIIVEATFGEILDSGSWDRFCDKYGYTPWLLNEGLADRDDVMEITREDAIEYGLWESPDA